MFPVISRAALSTLAMADSHSQHQTSKTERFIRGAGDVREDPDQKLWAPARWVVQMIQYLIAIIMVTIGEGFKSIFSGKSSRSRREHTEKKAA